MSNFLDLKQPAAGQRPGKGVGGNAPSGSAVGDFLNRPITGQRPIGDKRPVGNRPVAGQLPSNRPNRAVAGQLPSNRPNRIENRTAHREWRGNRGTHIRNHVSHHHPRMNFWNSNPHWARWRITRPYRWATWAAIGSWFPWGWSQPSYYNYGENVYYEGDNVYYGDQVTATTEEYANQAEQIVTSAPKIDEEKSEWMSLGVFALTQDSESSSADPTIFIQLAVSKEGVISGTVNNSATDKSTPIEGMVDKKSQRAAWVISGKTSPIMETGIANLTKDEAPALLHFSDGQTQQWLMVRLEEPKEEAKGSK